MENPVPFSMQVSLNEMVAPQGGGHVIIVTESVARNKPQEAFTVAEIRYFPGLLKECLGLISAEVFVFPLVISPKFQAMALIAKSDFNRNPVPFARQESVNRIVPTQGLIQGTIVLAIVFVKTPQVDVIVALMIKVPADEKLWEGFKPVVRLLAPLFGSPNSQLTSETGKAEFTENGIALAKQESEERITPWQHCFMEKLLQTVFGGKPGS